MKFFTQYITNKVSPKIVAAAISTGAAVYVGANYGDGHHSISTFGTGAMTRIRENEEMIKKINASEAKNNPPSIGK